MNRNSLESLAEGGESPVLVKRMIRECLLARRTGSLEGTGRRVHPDVHTRNEAASQLHVVVVEENKQFLAGIILL